MTRLAAFWSRGAPLLFALYGVALRLRQYASGRSLWLDEIAISLNVVDRSYGGLRLPLEHNQGAPLGWLYAEKTAVEVLGDSEYALRLVPFLSGVAAVFVFWWIARQLLPRHLVPVAVGFLAVSPFLVDYASETKQYSSDVLVGLLLLAVSLPLLADKPPSRAVLTWGGAGAVAVWFAHPAVFLLAGFAAVVLAVHAIGRRWRLVRAVLVGCLLWGGSFVVNYLTFLRTLNGNESLLEFWRSGFVPRPVAVGTTVGWLGRTWAELVGNPVGVPGVAGVAVVSLVAVAGLAALVRRDRRHTALLVSPFPAFVAGAALHAYPMRGRLVLVLVPFVLLIVCAAGAWLGRRRRPWLTGVAVFVAATLLAEPAPASVDGLREPRTVTEIEPALRHLAARQRPGDEVWIHFGADLALRWYGPKLGVRPDFVMSFRPAPGPCADPVRRVHEPGRRVWLVFAHLYSNAPPDERETYVSRFGSVGREVDSYFAPGASVHLLDPAAGRTPVEPVPRPRQECLAVHTVPMNR